MRKLAAVVFLVVALVGSTAAPAVAQNRFGGAYSGLSWGESFGNGFQFDLATFLHLRMVGGEPATAMSIFGDMSMHWFSSERTLFVVGGVREHFCLNTRLNPYIHGFGGLLNWSQTYSEGQSGTDAVFGGGGGLEYWATPSYALRAQYDLMLMHNESGWDSAHRLTFGATLKFGQK